MSNRWQKRANRLTHLPTLLLTERDLTKSRGLSIVVIIRAV